MIAMRLSLALATFLVFLSVNTHAYDEDTHFYNTYSMARFAGIERDVSIGYTLS